MGCGSSRGVRDQGPLPTIPPAADARACDASWSPAAGCQLLPAPAKAEPDEPEPCTPISSPAAPAARDRDVVHCRPEPQPQADEQASPTVPGEPVGPESPLSTDSSGMHRDDDNRSSASAPTATDIATSEHDPLYGFPSRAAYHEALLQYARAQQAAAGAVQDDAFGGTQADHDAESDFAQALTGPSAAGSGAFLFGGRPCRMGDPGVHGGDCPGEWLQALNQQGSCFLYVHTVTHEIRGTRPPGLPPLESSSTDAGEPHTAAKAGPQPEEPPPPEVVMADVEAASLEARRQNRVLLLIATEAGRTRMQQQAAQADSGVVWVDTRPFVLPFRRTRVKFPDAVEAARRAAVQAMRLGQTLLVDLHDCSPDFVGKFGGGSRYKPSFPLALFDPSDSAGCASVFQRGDGQAVLAAGVSVALLCTLPWRTYSRELRDVLPSTISLDARLLREDSPS